MKGKSRIVGRGEVRESKKLETEGSETESILDNFCHH